MYLCRYCHQILHHKHRKIQINRFPRTSQTKPFPRRDTAADSFITNTAITLMPTQYQQARKYEPTACHQTSHDKASSAKAKTKPTTPLSPVLPNALLPIYPSRSPANSSRCPNYSATERFTKSSKAIIHNAETELSQQLLPKILRRQYRQLPSPIPRRPR